jgi:glycosyltransferase involved in cell wall biosynthesis
MSLTTFNNKRYLQEFIYSWEKTKSHKYHWVLIIADNGSTDGTIEYLSSIKPFWQFTLIQKQGLSDAELVNTIFDECKNIKFDYGFYAENDVLCLKPGWDELYINAIEKSGYAHLCHQNNEYLRRLANSKKLSNSVLNERKQIDSSGYCSTIMDASQYLGVTKFFTFNRQTIERVGYADASKLSSGKEWQVDISKRASRAGFNDGNKYWDAKGSNEYLQIQGMVDDGDRLIAEYEKVAASLLAKSQIIEDKQRIYVDKPTELNLSKQKDYDLNQYFDNIYLINLDSQINRWHQASEWAKKYDINLTRFLGVDGNAPEHRKEWEDYARQGLVKLPADVKPIETTEEFYFNYQYDVARVAYIENKSGKKGIPTPEAWGYLLSVIHVLEDAITKGYQRILVLDDDIVPHKLIKSLFAQGMREAPEDWKIILLGAFQDLWDGYITPYSEHLYQSNGTNYGSFAMALDSSVFVPLLHHAKKFDLAFDVGAFHRVQRKYKDKCFAFINPLIIPDSGTRNKEQSDRHNLNGKSFTLDRVEEYLDLAKLKSEQKFWSEALTLYQQANSLSSRSDAYFGMGKALMKLGKHEEAIAAYRQAVTLGLSEKEQAKPSGFWSSKSELYNQLFLDLKSAIELHPKSAVIYQLMGDVAQELECWEEAITAYQRVTELTSNSVPSPWTDFNLSRASQHLKTQEEQRDVVLVFVPAYNAEATIRDSIYSVLNQTYDFIAVVAIDDCSTDQTFEILKEEEEKNINLRVFKTHKNLGTYNAVNYGLLLSKKLNFGFFAIHGADDLMFPEKIEMQLRELKKGTFLASLTGYARVDYQTKKHLKSKVNGHSMVIYSKKAFQRLGYYDDTRFGGDTEYFERFIACYGDDKVNHLRKILTIAYFSPKNLTASNQENSQARLNYVSEFRQEHIKMKSSNNFYVTNKVVEKITTSLVDEPKLTYFSQYLLNLDLVVCGVATLPERQQALKDTVESMLPQVDKLIVYQNGYKERFDFLNYDKIEVVSSLDTKIDMGDAGKFYGLNSYKNCYYFSIDDDLIYPSDYVSTLLKTLKKYDLRIIATCHGRVLKQNPESYYKASKLVHRCLGNVESEEFVHFGGTGVMAFHTSIVKINFNYFKTANMADIWMGLYARENNIPIMVIPHKAGWILHSDKFDPNNTIYEEHKNKDYVQSELIKNFDASKIIEVQKIEA